MGKAHSNDARICQERVSAWFTEARKGAHHHFNARDHCSSPAWGKCKGRYELSLSRSLSRWCAYGSSIQGARMLRASGRVHAGVRRSLAESKRCDTCNGSVHQLRAPGVAPTHATFPAARSPPGGPGSEPLSAQQPPQEVLQLKRPSSQKCRPPSGRGGRCVVA